MEEAGGQRPGAGRPYPAGRGVPSRQGAPRGVPRGEGNLFADSTRPPLVAAGRPRCGNMHETLIPMELRVKGEDELTLNDLGNAVGQWLRREMQPLRFGRSE